MFPWPKATAHVGPRDADIASEIAAGLRDAGVEATAKGAVVTIPHTSFADEPVFTISEGPDPEAIETAVWGARLLATASTSAVRFSATPTTVQAHGPGAVALVSTLPGAEWTEWRTRSDGRSQRQIEATVDGIRVWAAEVTS